MKVSDYIADFFDKKNIDVIFGYTGGNIADIIDSVFLRKNIRFVENYNEQGSSFCANGYAKVSEKTGISLASSGPGACNLINGIANAFYDSIPCVFITGNVHTLATKESENIRQNGFQETDIVSIVKNITKFSCKISNPNQIRNCLEKAFYIANEGRKGPVLIDIPYDIARSDVDVSTLEGFLNPSNVIEDIEIDPVLDILRSAKRPLILLGGGACSNICREDIKKLLAKVKIPVVASLCGLDVLDHDSECFVGFIGQYGNRYANISLVNCDCLIVLGSRLDERQICYKTKLNPNVKVIRVDVDKYELKRKIPETISINSTVENFLEKMLLQNFDEFNFSKWINVIYGWKNRYPSYDLASNEINANNFLNIISKKIPENAVVCADVGQNQMCVAQSFHLNGSKRLLNSSGLGAMGFALPAAIGVACAKKDTAVLSINGDGGLQMNIQELQTIKRENLPVNIIVLNNKCLGMIRRLHENMFDNRTSASIDGYEVPDFEKVANAYGIKYLRVDSVDKYSLVKDFISSSHPTFIEVILPQTMRCNPEPGECLYKQNPLLSEDEFDLIKRECEL